MSEEQKRLLSIVLEIYGRLVWTHKTHEKQRELDTRKIKRDKWINVILMGLSASGILVSIPLQTVWASSLATLFAFISFGFAIYQISFEGEADILLQRQASKMLLIERDKLLTFIERVMVPDADIEVLRANFDKTVERLGQLYASLPDTTMSAYVLASEGLKKNEEFTFSSEEIDKLLPVELRQAKLTPTSLPTK
ncbi:MAG: SLATT domain-containing protein [Chloroflexi bacterium]|nr:SLATT domain-containing protein [Chloroflexota bacterium]